MTLKQQMADDLESVLNAGEVDEAATYFPLTAAGEPDATGFAVRIVRGDITTGVSAFDQGTEHTRVTQAILLRAVVRAGCLDRVGTARDPRRGDRITFTEDDEDDAEWLVAAVGAVDVGGGMTVTLECDTYGSPGGTGATEVRS